MSAADDDLDTYAELLAARAKARTERLQKMKTGDTGIVFAPLIDKQNTDNQTGATNVKVDTPIETEQVVDCDSNSRKQEIASKRARRFEDILRRSEDEENTWEYKKPDYKNANKSPALNNSWSHKSPKLNLTVKESSPIKTSTPTKAEAKPVVTKEWKKPEMKLQATPTIDIEEQRTPVTSKIATNDLNVRSVKEVEEKPKYLQEFFSKAKEEEKTSDRSKKFVETVNMFQSMQQNASSNEDVDPSELPLNARKALFENAMFKGSDAKRARKEVKQYIPQPKPLFTPMYSNKQADAKHVVETNERESVTSEKFANVSDFVVSKSETNTDMEITNVYEEAAEVEQFTLGEVDRMGQNEQMEENEHITCEVNDSVISALKEIDNLSAVTSSPECAELSTGRLYPELPTLEQSEESFSYAFQSSPTKGKDLRKYSEFQQLSPIKQYVPPETKNESKPIMRTLSSYRREQKQLAVMNSPKALVTLKDSLHLERENKIKEQKQKDSETIETLRREVAEKHNVVISQSISALNVIFSSGEFLLSKERLEAEKILLVATQKRIRCVNEIQRLKESLNKRVEYEAVNGTALISTILVHVKGDFVLAQVGNYDKFKHYFICLLHANGKVISTELLSASNVIENACLTFTNNVPFNELKSDFNIDVEVYGLALPKNTASKKDGPKFLSLTPKKSKQKHMSSPKSPAGPNVVRSSNFTRLGYAVINMKSRYNTKHELREFIYDSPLEGTIEVMVNTRAAHEVSIKGDLSLLEIVDGFRSWNRRWCILKGYYLAYWRFAKEETTKESLGVIDLRQCLNPNFGSVPHEVCAKKNSFAIVTQTANQKSVKDNYKTVSTTMHLISADTSEEFEVWCSKLEELVSNIRLWEPDAVKPLDVSNFEKALM